MFKHPSSGTNTELQGRPGQPGQRGLAGGALGIAAYGALAGTPTRVGLFLAGLHAAGLASCALYAVAAMASLRWLAPLRPSSAASR